MISINLFRGNKVFRSWCFIFLLRHFFVLFCRLGLGILLFRRRLFSVRNGGLTPLGKQAWMVSAVSEDETAFPSDVLPPDRIACVPERGRRKARAAEQTQYGYGIAHIDFFSKGLIGVPADAKADIKSFIAAVIPESGSQGADARVPEA